MRQALGAGQALMQGQRLFQLGGDVFTGLSA
jgi:hypothetical protein